MFVFSLPPYAKYNMAVYIELVSDMSVSSIFEFFRFTNVNGIPSHLYSDNRTFSAAARVISKGMLTVEFKEKSGSHHRKRLLFSFIQLVMGVLRNGQDDKELSV